MKYNILSILAAVMIGSCTADSNQKVSNTTNKDSKVTDSVSAYPSINAEYVAVIEIPAGTNKKIEQNKENLKFEVDQRDGKDRIIQFLSYPANYGFVKYTLSDKTKGGDGDAVDVLVIGESIPTGKEIAIIPIATLQLIDDGEEDYKIVAVPADASLNVILGTGSDQIRNWEAIQSIIQTWFSNYDTDPAEIKGWLNQEQTKAYIQANRTQP